MPTTPLLALVAALFLSPVSTGYPPISQDAGQREHSRAPERTAIPEPVRLAMIEGFHWVVVDVRLNGKGPFRMILDTGAGTTVLNEDLVQELGLVATGTDRIGDPSNPRAQEVDVLVLDTIELGAARFDGVSAVGWRGDLVATDGIRGVLGFPTFAECLVTLNYPAGLVEISTGALPEPDGAQILPMTATGGPPSIPIEIAGFAFEAHLDAGNSGSLVVPAEWLERMPLVEGSRARGRGRRASGPIEFTAAQLDGVVRLGSAVVASPQVHFDDTLPFVNVGHAILSRFRVTLDQRAGRIRFEPAPADAPQPKSPPRRMGVQLAAKGGAAFSVAMVVPVSAAETAGLQVGDVLLEVDGAPFTQGAMMEALRGTAPVVLAVERDGERLTLTAFARE